MNGHEKDLACCQRIRRIISSIGYKDETIVAENNEQRPIALRLPSILQLVPSSLMLP